MTPVHSPPFQVSSAHRQEVHALAADPAGRFIVTAGHDALVKLWAAMPRSMPLSMLRDSVPPHQAFAGHTSAVWGEWENALWVGDKEAQGPGRAEAKGGAGIVPKRPKGWRSEGEKLALGVCLGHPGLGYSPSL